MKTTHACLLAAAVALTFSAAATRAQDLLDNALNDKAPDTAQPTAKPAAKPAEEKPTRPNMPDIVSPDAAKQLDDQDLLNKLTGQGNAGAEQGGGPAAKMNEIMERMSQSESRLAKEKDAGLTTQEVQSRIMVDIDSMIELLKKQESQSKSQGQSQPKQGDQRQQTQQQQQQQQSQGSKAATESKLPGGGITEPGSAQTDMREGRLTWGELPAKDRDLVANGIKEKFLPEYEDMIKRYYEALAELGKSDKEK